VVRGGGGGARRRGEPHRRVGGMERGMRRGLELSTVIVLSGQRGHAPAGAPPVAGAAPRPLGEPLPTGAAPHGSCWRARSTTASRDARGVARRAASVRGSNQRNEERIRVCSFLSEGLFTKCTRTAG
jgi:hypothetical protein